jgi:hypothetical protein
MIQPIRMANRTKAMNAPMSGQNTGRTLYEAAGDGHACRATCSLALGNAHATWRRRSWRKTKRSWLGGRNPSGRSGRKVGQGPPDDTAHNWLTPKKQASQLARPAFVRPGAMPMLCSFTTVDGV